MMVTMMMMVLGGDTWFQLWNGRWGLPLSSLMGSKNTAVQGRTEPLLREWGEKRQFESENPFNKRGGALRWMEPNSEMVLGSKRRQK